MKAEQVKEIGLRVSVARTDERVPDSVSRKIRQFLGDRGVEIPDLFFRDVGVVRPKLRHSHGSAGFHQDRNALDIDGDETLDQAFEQRTPDNLKAFQWNIKKSFLTHLRQFRSEEHTSE